MSLRAVVTVSLLSIPLAGSLMRAQDHPLSEPKLPVRAALVLTPDFCASRVAHGAHDPKKGLEVGKVACLQLEPAIREDFENLATVADAQKTGGAQLVLIPEFIDVGVAIEGVTAFSDQELTLLLQWTAKDASGRMVWLETVRGSAIRHVGNVFTARKNRRLIIDDAVQDAAVESSRKILSSPELRNVTR
jgi:hypothetical protein